MPLPAQTAPRTRDTVRVGALEIDRTPVTNERYAEFVAASAHRAPAYWSQGECPASLRDHPVVGVDFFDALAFALWAGGRLPTEREWSLASGCEGVAAYAWGAEFDSSRCNTVRSGLKGTSAVGAFPGGNAPSGCTDLCGNVWEMTCTPYPDDIESIIVKGGSWYDYPAHARMETRFRARVNKAGTTVGFRLAYGGEIELPAFLDVDLAQACIDFREAKAAASPREAEGSEEFLDIVSELRAEAATHLPDLEEPMEVDLGSVGELQDFFDAVDAAPLPDPDLEESTGEGGFGDKAQALARLEAIFERMQLLASEHPRALMGALAAAMLLVITLLWSSATGEPDRPSTRSRELAARDATDPAEVSRNRAPPIILNEPPRAAPAQPRTTEPEPHVPMVKMPPPDQAMADILRGAGQEREEAERYLIGHPEQARERVESALTAEIEPEAKSSLRYVLAALDEQSAGRAQPEAVSSPPSHGLVYFVDRMSGPVGDGLAMVRHTAKAEGLPITVVYAGDGDGHALFDSYGSLLKDVDYYVDRNRDLARRVGATGTPALAGLDAGGRVSFIHVGTLARSALVEKLTSLKR